MDVLEGRIEIRPEELFELIHRTNPTGRELPQPEAARRYELKSRLQSLLIRRFGDRHVVVRPGEHDGVVSLVHRSGARDACHAMLSELEPEARSWVRWRLDVEASPGRDGGGPREPGIVAGFSAPAEDDPAGAEELLRRGTRAIDDFDYEAAEKDLRLALERSGGGAEAAAALLELWVGLLGMDRQALDVEPRLGAEATAQPGVRALLALAAARLGESERALELLAGIAGAPAAEVQVALAARAIRERDPNTADLRLEAAAEHDPTHPRLRSLADEVAALRAESQRPAVEALERRLREEGFLAAEDDARALLARWPESEVARRVLRQVAAHRQAEEIAAHLARGEKALAGEEFHQAAVELQAALGAGSERPDLPDLIERARLGERRRREAARLEAAVADFSSGDLKRALAGYLSLSAALRERLRRRVDRRELDWLEEVVARDGRPGAPRSGAKAQTAASAVLALGRAIDELRAGRAQTALDELASHRETLAEIAEARRCLAEARSQVAAGRRARARDVLAAARKAYAAARLERARELLEGVDAEDLVAGDRESAEDLLAAIGRSETARRLERELARHLASDDLLGALERARQLVEQASEEGERRRWRRRAETLRARLRAAWRLEIVAGDAPLREVRDVRLDTFEDKPRFWLDDAGQRLVLATSWVDRLFLRVIAVRRRRVVSRVSLRTPEPLGETLDVCLDGDRLWIAGEQGHLLELAVGSWDVLSWRPLRDLLPEDAAIETVTLLPGGHFVWLRVKTPDGDWQFRVVDLKAWRVSRKLPDVSTVLAIAGPDEPRVVTSEFRSGARLHTARGAAGRAEPLIGCYVYSAAISPDAEGLVLAIQRPRLAGEGAPDGSEDPEWADDEHGLLLFLVADSDRGDATDPATGVRLDDVYVDGANLLATSLEQRLIYALVQYDGSERGLLILAVPGEAFEVLHQVEVPLDTVLVQDGRSRHVVALMAGETRIDAVPLGRAGPRGVSPPEPRARLDCLLPLVGELSYCGNPTGAGKAHLLARLGWWRDMPVAELRAWLEGQAKEHAGDPDELVLLCLALRHRDDLEAERRRIADELARRHPRHGGVALLAADLEARAGNWREVERLLDRAELGDLEGDDGRSRHFHHLLGLARLRAGRTEEALAAFEKGDALERGSCMLRPLIHLTRPMSDPPEPHEHGPDQPVVRQLLGAIRLADRALAAGDAASALAALDRPVVWHAAELQSAARLAAAHLETAVSDPSERFRKRLALALFQHVYQAREQALVEISLPGLSWDQDRLADVAGRARAWLEEDRGDESVADGRPDRLS